MQRLCVGFDGMCADVSVLGLGPHIDAIRAEWPVIAPLMDSLARGLDEELTCEGSGIDEPTFQGILESLKAYPGATVDVHIGANTALELATASNLMRAPAAPITATTLDYLGFWSPRTLARVPEKLPQAALKNARAVEDSEAVSLIMPHGGKRAILSFGGNPPVRSMSAAFRAYLRDEVPRYFAAARPGLLILVGTGVTWSAAAKGDFALLAGIIAAAHKNGARVLLDLSGMGSWSDAALRDYFAIVATADILSMNEGELAVYFGRKTGAEPPGLDAASLAAMVRAVVRPGQGFLVHTPDFQLALGIDGPVDAALRFAGKAATYRAATGRFPTALEVNAATFPISGKGRAALAAVPQGFAAVPGYTVEVRNPVGLGDTWTCSFALALLGGAQ
ncbi:MAG TPA: hypothetical protein PKX48_00855 [Planctomycetota bacterium]|jgi:sugar/nucleoside kinase (ribokinase family)|nr:hypothetical protein [Planctomycetota bacterium]OQC21969.1 MAG: hypothetical protein BWX69_00275 [Planctomycetes bacterium ADurb.Bin069]NMD34518.1 hypothetical protein [Planctomycetota bacterium]HNR98147.1 hypothetical protein [Planctomycetota bacterium]HNU24966.1 hypothetical protein [Planctomycetota bacterium]